MEEIVNTWQLMVLGCLGFICSYIIEASSSIYEIFRWGAVVAPTVLALYKFYKEFKKRK